MICLLRRKLSRYSNAFGHFRINIRLLFLLSRLIVLILNTKIVVTPKELYDWAVQNEVEDYDILVDGLAIDYNPPVVDPDIGVIEINRR
nr:MAG TPA: hypothetical protein [Caudoviricetes sp.]